MARLVTYDDSRPSMDHFGDTLVRDPYETYGQNPPHASNDASTITTAYTSGTRAPEPKVSRHSSGQTEAELLAAQYKDSPPHREPSIFDGDKQSTNRLTYVDEDYNYYPSKPLPAIDDKQDAPLVQNAADVGRSGSYQDLGKTFCCNSPNLFW